MVFASLAFLYVFLPINIILYYLSKNTQYRNTILILFSFIFYAWGEPVYILLLIASSTVDYFNGRLIYHYRNTQWSKVGVICTIIFNVGLLCTFKYLGFIYENINLLFGTQFKSPGLALPIGISFYTFKTISYVIDVYWEKVPVQKSWWKFMLFVSLYHQLVAGPIVRYADIAKEIDHRRFDIFDISKGVFRFCIGLFKKVAIANVAGEFVVKYLDGSLADLTTIEAWFGICMFAIQIFFDFSAYSDMAIGLGQMFGFHYHENFNYPYISKSVTEFWRRWHISLSSWLNEYLFIPLSFSFRKLHKTGTVLALIITFFLSGLWHGASWNFVLWGVYFGVIIALEQFLLLKLFSKLPRFFSHLYLIFVIILSMCLFYFTDSNRLFTFVPMLFSNTNGFYNAQILQTLSENIFWLIIAIALCCPIFLRVKELLKRSNLHYNSNILWTAMTITSISLLFISTIMLVGKSYNPFIYYRF